MRCGDQMNDLELARRQDVLKRDLEVLALRNTNLRGILGVSDQR